MLLIIDSILLILGIVGIVVATYSDLKTTEVPDYSNYFLIFSAICLRLLYSLTTSNWDYSLVMLRTFPFIFVLALLMYYTKQWGGGDAKLLMGLSLVFATPPIFLQKIFSPNLDIDFPFILFLNILLAGIFYSLVYAIFLIFKHKNKTFPAISKSLNSVKKYQLLTFLIFLILISASFIFTNSDLSFFSMLLGITILILFYFFIIIKAIEKTIFVKTIPIKKLMEGDWILHKIYSGKKLIYSPSQDLTKSRISLLKKYNIKKVTIKEGIVFTPSFAIGFVLSLIWGNLFSLII